MTWSDLTDEWLNELSSDEAYESVVTPLLIDLLRPTSGNRYLDLGSGEGRVMRTIAALGAVAHGVELNPDLASRASGPVVVADLSDLRFIRDNVYDGAYCVLVLEHIEDHAEFFRQTSRVARPEGSLVLVMNHPAWTAPGSTPIGDADGEVLWRPGEYFSRGSTEERMGGERVTFHHRTLGDLVTKAADAGWRLETMIERPHHELTDQSRIPRLLACRWRLLP